MKFRFKNKKEDWTTKRIIIMTILIAGLVYCIGNLLTYYEVF